MKRFVGLAFLVALAVPAAVIASPPSASGPSTTTSQPSAAQLCKQQFRSLGKGAFRDLYAKGGSLGLAMQNCRAQQLQLSSQQAKNAAKACQAERASMGVADFNKKYGASGNGGGNGYQKNAFGKCVSMKARELSAEQQQETLSAAKTCKAERQSMGVSDFNKKYGTNSSKSNAFGKCVQKTSGAQQGQ